MRDIIPLAGRLAVSTAAELAELVITVYGEDTIEHVHGGRDDLLLYCAAVERVLRLQDSQPGVCPEDRR